MYSKLRCTLQHAQIHSKYFTYIVAMTTNDELHDFPATYITSHPLMWIYTRVYTCVGLLCILWDCLVASHTPIAIMLLLG